MQIFLYLCSVKMKFFVIGLFLMCSLGLLAEDKYAYMTQHSELRIGWGDQLFESLVWHNPTSITTTMPESYRQTYRENYHHDQHVWMEYQWRFKHWFSLGAMVDWSDVRWDVVTRNGRGAELSRTSGHWFYNIVVMPTFRFTYLHHPNVNLYSGIGLGMDINGGSELDGWGNQTVVGAAVQFTVLGISANYERWFWFADFGGLYALKNGNTIFMASSKIISAGLGVRF